jgi:hypothetical protein
MTNNIIQFPTSTPTPPRPTFSRMLVFLRRVLAIWRSAMSAEYRDLLPVIIPTHWSIEKILHFANGGTYPKPAFTATIGQRVNVRTGWVGQAMGRVA